MAEGDEPIDLARRRKQRDLKRAGYGRGLARYAEPSEAGLAAMVDLKELDEAGLVVVLLGPPEFQGVIPDAWRLDADGAERIARELMAKAADLRARAAPRQE